MKRTLALALCLMLLCPAVLAETYSVYISGTGEGTDYNMLIRDDGTPLLPEGEYYNIYEITPPGTPEEERLYGAVSNDVGIAYTPEKAEEMLYEFVDSRVALMNARGERVTGYDYTELEYANGVVLFTLPGEDRLTGAMDAAGRVIMDAAYVALKPQGDGWLAAETDVAYERYRLLRIEEDGSVRELGLHSGNPFFDVSPEGICAVDDVEEYGGQTVFIGPAGNVLFGRGFQYAECFVGDHAVVAEEERYGVIDLSGVFIVPPEYDYILWEDGKPCIGVRGAAFDVYDPGSFRLLMDADFAPSEDFSVSALTADLVGVTVDDRDLIYSSEGELLLEVSGERSIQMYGYGDRDLRLIEETGVWPNDTVHLIDLEGRAVSGDYRMIYESRWQGDHGRYVTVTFSTYTDTDGEDVANWSSYRYGLIDENGRQLLPQAYDELRALSFDRYWAVQGDRRGMIDAEGKWLYSCSDYQSLMD